MTSDSVKQSKIAVIGAGVVGLSTAVCIQENIPSAKITIFADKFEIDTLSIGAGGLFRPVYAIDPDKQKVYNWCKASLDHFLSVLSTDASAAGIQQVHGYHISSSSAASCKNPLLAKLLPCHDLSKDELSIFPKHFKYGTFCSSLIIDCRYYLPWLQRKFLNAGGEIISKHFDNLAEVPCQYEIIVNCTGLGAKSLLNDDLLIPIRGQTIKVKAPWVKQFYYGDDAYILPGIDYVTLGGIKDFDSWNMQVNLYQKQFIWDKCVELLPSLKQAEFKWDWVGLRPYRPSVRVDLIMVKCDGKFRKVINNYGHGGHGVTLSWGTAMEAMQLVKSSLAESLLAAKL